MHDGWWVMGDDEDSKRCLLPFASETFDEAMMSLWEDVWWCGLAWQSTISRTAFGPAEIVPVVLLVRPNPGGSIPVNLVQLGLATVSNLSLCYPYLLSMTCYLYDWYTVFPLFLSLSNYQLHSGRVSKMGGLTIQWVFYWHFRHLTSTTFWRARSWPIGLTGKGSYSISIPQMRSMCRSFFSHFSLSKSWACSQCSTCFFDYGFFFLLHVIAWYLARMSLSNYDGLSAEEALGLYGHRAPLLPLCRRNLRDEVSPHLTELLSFSILRFLDHWRPPAYLIAEPNQEAADQIRPADSGVKWCECSMKIQHPRIATSESRSNLAAYSTETTP